MPVHLLMQHKLPSWVNYYHPHNYWSFPCGSAGKESAYNVGDLGSTPGLGKPPGLHARPREISIANLGLF